MPTTFNIIEADHSEGSPEQQQQQSEAMSDPSQQQSPSNTMNGGGHRPPPPSGASTPPPPHDDEDPTSILTMLPFTLRGRMHPASFSQMVAGLMALDHFSRGDPSVVPELPTKRTLCPELHNMTSVFVDSQGDATVVAEYLINQVVALQLHRQYMAVVGLPSNDAALSALQVAVGMKIPMVTSGADSTSIGTHWYNSLGATTNVNLNNMARVIVSYLARRQRRKEVLATIAVTHEFGADLRQAIAYEGGATQCDYSTGNGKDDEPELAPCFPRQDSYALAPPFTGYAPDRGAGYALQQILKAGIRNIVLVLSAPHIQLEAIANHAAELGMLDTKENYVWILAAERTQQLSEITNAAAFNQNMSTLLQGMATVVPLDGFLYEPEEDRFLKAWRAQNETFVERINQAYPIQQSAEQPGFYQAPPDYFQTHNPMPGAGFLYDAVMTVALAKCELVHQKKNGPPKGAPKGSPPPGGSGGSGSGPPGGSGNSPSSGHEDRPPDGGNGSGVPPPEEGNSYWSPPPHVANGEPSSHDKTNGGPPPDEGNSYWSPPPHVANGDPPPDGSNNGPPPTNGNNNGGRQRRRKLKGVRQPQPQQEELDLQQQRNRKLQEPKKKKKKKGTNNPFMLAIQRVDFTGATGKVQLNQSRSFPGGRNVDTVTFGTYNFRTDGNVSTYHLTDIHHGPLNESGRWVDGPDAPFIYANGLATPPLLNRDLPEQNYLQKGVHVTGLIFLTIALVAALASAVVVMVKRDAGPFRQAQPPFLLMLILGTIIMSFSILTLAFDESYGWTEPMLSAACVATPWLIFVGYSSIYLALFSKLFRINKVMQFRRVQVRKRDVVGPFVISMLLTVAILIAWSSVDPFRWVRTVIDEDTAESYGKCQSDNATPFLVPLVCLLVLSTIACAVMAYKCRDIEERFSDSNYIFYTIFVHIQVLLVGVPVLVILADASANAAYLGRSLLIFAIVMTTLSLMIAPKAAKTYAMHHRDSKKSIRTGGSGGVRVGGINDNSTITRGSKSQDWAQSKRDMGLYREGAPASALTDEGAEQASGIMFGGARLGGFQATSGSFCDS